MAAVSSEVKASLDKPLIFSASPAPKPAQKDFLLSTEELKKLAESGDPVLSLFWVKDL